MKTKGSVHLGKYPEQHQEICVKFLHKYALEGRNPKYLCLLLFFALLYMKAHSRLAAWGGKQLSSLIKKLKK